MSAARRILMTEGASSSSRQTLYCLSEDWQVDLCAPSPWCQSRFSSRVHRWLRCPRLRDSVADYFEFLLRTLDHGNYDVLLPTNEEVLLCSYFRDTLGKKAGLAVPDVSAIRQLQSKIGFAEVMQALGLPMPATQIMDIDQARQTPPQLPCFVKVEYGTASLGVRRVESRDQLDVALDAFASDPLSGDRLVFQQPASGVHCVAQAVFREGQLMAAHCTEALELGFLGSPMLRTSASHPIVLEHLRNLGDHLQWHGAMFLEYFYDRETQTPVYIEANPRIGEVVNARLCGVNLVDLLLRISLGEHCEPIPMGKIGVLSHLGYIWCISHGVRGASRTAIFRLWRDLRRRQRSQVENEMTRPHEDPWSRVPAAATLLQLLVRPASAENMLHSAVRDYAMPSAAVEQLDAIAGNEFAP